MLSKIGDRMSYPVLGYLYLLLGLMSLGLSVAAMAFGSDLALVAGVAFVAFLAASVVSFRKGATKLAQARGVGDAGHNVSIWSKPIRKEQVDQYNANFRQGQGGVRRSGLPARDTESESELPGRLEPVREAA